MSQKLKGTVKWFNDAKGFGFIEHESGRDVFVHFSVIEGEGYKTLKDGEPVEYEIIEGDKGLHAKSVIRLSPPVKKIGGGLAIEIEVVSGDADDGNENINNPTVPITEPEDFPFPSLGQSPDLAEG